MVEQVRGIEEIQSEHRKWESDHSEWQAAIDEWRQDHKKFVEDLSRARNAIEEYRFVLETHASAIAEYHSRLEAQDHSLKQDGEAQEGGGLRESLLEIHRDNEAKHDRQRRLHERIRQHHEAVKEALAKLEAAAQDL
jgi:chromosome segregation ATPase